MIMNFSDKKEDNTVTLIWTFIELLFLIDLGLNFFKEFKTEEKFTPVRDLEKIA